MLVWGVWSNRAVLTLASFLTGVEGSTYVQPSWKCSHASRALLPFSYAFLPFPTYVKQASIITGIKGSLGSYASILIASVMRVFA